MLALRIVRTGFVLAWLVHGVVSGCDGAAAAPFRSLDIRDVRVGGEIGRRVDVTVQTNLLMLDAEKDFLEPFRSKGRNDGYVGLGKLIDASVRFAAHTGDPRVVALKKQLTSGAIAAQEPDGYLGLMKPERRMWVLWDVHEMSYLVLGLCADHRYFGEKASLGAAVKLGEYMLARWEDQPPDVEQTWKVALNVGVTGVESAMLALHAETGEGRFLEFVRRTRALAAWDARIAIGRWGHIEGHAYSHLSRCLAQLRLNDVARDGADPRLLKPSRDVMEFLFKGDGLTVTGEVGDHECWHDTQEGTVNLGETCASAYLLRWLDEMLRRDGDMRLGDVMERVVFNGLFAAQSPDGRRIRYYTPFDGPRSYYKGDAYCCPCNYRRIVAELPGMICYGVSGGAAVNLYTASTAKLRLDGGAELALRQETGYPASGGVAIVPEPSKPARFALRLRVPQWCAQPAASVNGEAARIRPGQECLLIEREWKAGDRVDLDFPMPWRLVRGRVAQAGRVAVMRGPTVYCLSRARHPELAAVDLRLLVIDPGSIETVDGERDPTGAPLCRVRAWAPGAWYPGAKPALALTLAPFPDPGGEAVYFKVPNPNAAEIIEDELVRRRGGG